jgi:hypothetical protein
MLNLTKLNQLINRKQLLKFKENLNILEKWNNVILYDGLWGCYLNYNLFNNKIIACNNLFLNSCYYMNNFQIINLKLLISEYDLKGVNYRFSLYYDTILFDLGQSSFKILNFYFKSFFFKLKKKRFKRLLLISINKSSTAYLQSFIWFNLKKVGPYKLKGFQFINEWIKLKEGKKPFK